MTKQKTLRESSKRLSKRYKFKRTLATRPSIVKDLHDRDQRVNRVRPVKDILIWEPMELYPVPDSPGDAVADSLPGVRISKYNTNWPFRIEYVEQLLDVDTIWVVVADHQRRAQQTYAGANGALSSQNLGGISLAIITIKKPTVMVGVGHYRQPIIEEKELREIEKGLRPTAMIYGSDSVWIEGRPNECIDIYECNILPQSLTMYNCTFYHRDVAQLYLDSLSEHIKRFVNTQSPHNY